MLTRSGSSSGCAWMRNTSERLARGPRDASGTPLPRAYWFIYVGILLIVVLTAPLAGKRMMPDVNAPAYESPQRIGGLPLFASGLAPVGIIAVGARPRGIVALGGIATGVVAVGGIALGGIAFGGVSLGLLALAGLAVGWWAIGGGALGYHAFGGLAVGGHAYAGGGVALGYYEASGGQKEKLFG